MNEASTIAAGAKAPDFTLEAANRFNSRKDPLRFTLKTQIARAPVILEFLRGTW